MKSWSGRELDGSKSQMLNQRVASDRSTGHSAPRGLDETEVLEAPGIQDKTRHLAGRISLEMNIGIRPLEVILQRRFELLWFRLQPLQYETAVLHHDSIDWLDLRACIETGVGEELVGRGLKPGDA